MKVYLVIESDCENSNTICICSTLKIAERELFKSRDNLIKHWKDLDTRTNKLLKVECEKQRIKYEKDNMYSKMIENLSSNDYKKWDNYPHETISIQEMEVLTK